MSSSLRPLAVQYGALLLKALQLKSREVLRSFIELVVPTVFTLLLAIGYWLADKPSATATSYAGNGTLIPLDDFFMALSPNLSATPLSDGFGARASSQHRQKFRPVFDASWARQMAVSAAAAEPPLHPFASVEDGWNDTTAPASPPPLPQVPEYFLCQMPVDGLKRDVAFPVCPTSDKHRRCLDGNMRDICYDQAWFWFFNALVQGMPVLKEGTLVPYSLSQYLALARWVYLEHPQWDNFGERSPRMSLFHTGYLMLVGPKERTEPFRRFCSGKSALCERVLFPGEVTSASDAEAYAYDNGASVWAILDLSNFDAESGDLQYTVRMNFTATPWTGDVIDRFIQGLGHERADLLYMNSGFLTLQGMVHEHAADLLADHTQHNGHAITDAVNDGPIGNLVHGLGVCNMPTPGYATSNFLLKSGHFIPLVMTFGFLYALSRLLSSVVEEKETRTREAMFIMGLRPGAFYGSWVTIALAGNVIACLIAALAGVFTFFDKIDYSVLFVTHLLFANTISALGFILSAVFARSRVAALVGPLLLFITTVPHYAIPKNTSVNIIYAVSILPCTAYAQAIDQFTQYATSGMRFTWADAWDGEYSCATAMLFMVADFVVYMLVALYLDLVVPGEHGKPLHPLFFLPKALRCHRSPDTLRRLRAARPIPPLPLAEPHDVPRDPSNSYAYSPACASSRRGTDGGRRVRSIGRLPDAICADDEARDATATTADQDPLLASPASAKRTEASLSGLAEQRESTNADFAAVTSEQDVRVGQSVRSSTYAYTGSEPPVRIRQLCKRYTTANHDYAVNGLSLDIRNDEILVLLGHNGAGKSTTMHMITGMLEPSDGDVSIYGNSIAKHPLACRQGIGFCPQHNILWPHLSVLEHLEFFAVLKAHMTRQDAKREAVRYALAVGLEPHVLARALSGGQKRKLSVAIALIGDSPFVLLDEPTAGMDANARRDMWEMLLDRRQGRAMLLSTHYMDEADLLGSRIAIMDHGCLHSIGTSFFLKSKLGTGYRLTVSLRDGANLQMAAQLIRQHCPAARLHGDVPEPEDPADDPGVLDCSPRSAPSTRRLAPSPRSGRKPAAAVTDACDERADGPLDFSTPRGSSGMMGVPVSTATTSHSAARLSNTSFTRRAAAAAAAAQAAAAASGTRDEELWLPSEFVDDSAAAERLFRALEEQGAAFGITSYGLSLTTLEDVFVGIAEQPSSALAAAAADDPVAGAGAASRSAADTSASHATPLYGAAGHDGVAGGGHHAGSNPAKVDPATVPMSAPLLLAGSGAQDGSVADRSFSRHLRALLIKRFHCAKRDRKALCFQVVLPVLFMAFALLLMLLKPPNQPALTIASTMYPDWGSEVLYLRRGASPDFSTAASNLTKPYAPVAVDASTTPFRTDSVGLISERLKRDLLNHTEPRWIALANRQEVSGFAASHVVTLLHNSTSPHSVVQATSAAANAAIREAARFAFARDHNAVRPSATHAKLTVTNHPLPLSRYEKKTVTAIMQIVSALFVLIPFTFIPAQFVAFTVRERETKAKHLQWVSGADVGAYWVSTAVADLLAFLVTEALAICIFLAFQRAEFVGDVETFFATVCLFLFYGLSMVPASCLLSFAFDQSGPAQNTVLLGNFFFGFLLVLAAQILAASKSTREVNLYLCWAYRLIPSYALGEGIIALTGRDMSALMLNGQKPGAFSMLEFHNDYGGFIGGVGTSLIYMGCTAPVFFAALFVLEKWRVAKYQLELKTAAAFASGDATTTRNDGEEDSDVAAERAAVESGEGRGDDCLTVQRLRKVYTSRTPPKVAVDDVSFGVHRGEIFAFLGTNGAGKTTTMSVLTGDVVQTAGRAIVSGFDVSLQPERARMCLGYCPQFDALHADMTAMEHMALYSRLKGVPEHLIRRSAEHLLRGLGVFAYRDKPSRELSGGNKRKLSIAIALVGDPSVVLLDEPSAGMDPLARRVLWGELEGIAKSRSVVLTTHHLEEVEALADRAAIMVAGKLRCIGSLQHLKSKFGGGAYELTATCGSEEAAERFCAAAAAALDAKLLERHALQRHFSLAQIPLSRVFGFLSAQKTRCEILSFGVTQASIEQVFLRISAANDAEGDDADGVAAVAVAGGSMPGGSVRIDADASTTGKNR